MQHISKTSTKLLKKIDINKLIYKIMKATLIVTEGKKHLHIGYEVPILPNKKSMVTKFEIDELFLHI